MQPAARGGTGGSAHCEQQQPTLSGAVLAWQQLRGVTKDLI